MSSISPHPPREQLCNRYCSNKHTHLSHYTFSPRSLVCGGQTSPHKPRLVVSHSTCSPLPSSPHAHSFVLGTAVINNNNPGGLGSFFKRVEPGKTGRHPVLKYRVPHGSQKCTLPLALPFSSATPTTSRAGYLTYFYCTNRERNVIASAVTTRF